MTPNIDAWVLAGVLAVILGDSSGRAFATEATAPAAPLVPATTLIGEAPCDAQSQCHVVGIGAKPCGGPSSYLAWSSKTTDPSALRASVDAEARAVKAEDERRGTVSDCRVAPEPTAVCRPRTSDGAKTCQLSPGGVRSPI